MSLMETTNNLGSSPSSIIVCQHLFKHVRVHVGIGCLGWQWIRLLNNDECFGVKQGIVGCLHSLQCNHDTSSGNRILKISDQSSLGTFPRPGGMGSTGLGQVTTSQPLQVCIYYIYICSIGHPNINIIQDRKNLLSGIYILIFIWPREVYITDF